MASMQMKDAPWWATLVLTALGILGTWVAKPDASAGRADSQDDAVVVLLNALIECQRQEGCQ